ncbi:MAG TPA: 3-oxoacyl-ACP reductase, partial [Nocardioidaceae bacterium]|nr:3-oxoacyl-ACP reductase [Nocardioidaceae bacterium]
MASRYQSLIRTPVGQLLAKNLGLPNPTPLERYQAGSPLVTGTVQVGDLGGSGRLAKTLVTALDELGIATEQAPEQAATSGSQADGAPSRVKGIVVDATGLDAPDRLVELQRFLTPQLRRLDACGRIVVLGTPPEATNSLEERIAQRALEGVTRSLGKEMRKGSTVQLVYVAPAADAALTSTLGFLLSPKSAYVSGQVIRIGSRETSAEPVADWTRPLAGTVALVTGASRGIGAEIARVLHRDGATVVGVDVPQAAGDLQTVMGEIDGDHLALDITTGDAPQRIARHLTDHHGGVDIVVHNAGITRDRKLANMKEDGWTSTIAVNLEAPKRITEELLAQKVIRPNGRIIGVSSIAGIAGNAGQTNYAASKAGVIGLVDGLADQLPDRITVNAVAPGFIHTKMTAATPLLTREIGSMLNSLQQG